MTTPKDNLDNVKKIIMTSYTLSEALQKLGLSYHSNYKWISDFARDHKIKNKGQ